MNETRRTPYTDADRISAAKIRAYMWANVEDHVDPLTGEVNNTTLAEDACQHFNAYEDTPEEEAAIPEKFFEIALKVGDAHEIKTGVKEPRITSRLAGLINSRSSADL